MYSTADTASGIAIVMKDKQNYGMAYMSHSTKVKQFELIFFEKKNNATNLDF